MKILFFLDKKHRTHQELLDVFVVGDDSVVHDHKLLLGIATLRMRVQLGRCTVSRPSGVRNADMIVDRLVQTEVVSGPDFVFQHLDFAGSPYDLDSLVDSIVAHACGWRGIERLVFKIKN